MATIKLKDGEDARLAKLLRNICRPRSQEEADELDVWLKRLEGGRQ